MAPRFLAVLAVLVALPAQAAPRHRLRPAPAPAWVTKIEPDRTPRKDPETENGAESLLDDTQLRFGARQKARFLHYADRVVTTEGIDYLSPLRFDFDPEYEQVQLHFVRIHRGRRTIDVLRTAEVKLVDVESELDRRLFDGRRSMIVIPRDLRVGDVLESALTITGRNPVLGAHAVGYLSLGGDSTRRLHARLLVEAGLSPVRVRRLAGAPAPAVRTTAQGTEQVWDLADPPPIEEEDRLPPWYEQYPIAAYSDFPSWEAVRDWALPLYPPRPPTAAMARRVKEWKQAGARPQDRALLALRFVQDDVRYLGFELGPNSHAPHPPERVFAQRFGDCKDKSYLLVTLLRAMGIEAEVALVDSDGFFNRELPTPFAFDHVIVRAAIAGRVYWIDPTWNLQGGTLDTQETPPLGHALVVRAGSPVLEAIGESSPKEPTRVVHERFEVDEHGAAKLEVVSSFERHSADDARANHAGAQARELDRHYRNFYSKQWAGVRSTRLPQVEDDRLHNRFVIKEWYAIPEFWRDGEVTLGAHLVDDQLEEPEVRLRQAPLRLRFPLLVEHRLDVLLPKPFDIETVDDEVEHDGVAFHRSVTISDRTVSMRYRFATTARDVPVAGVAAHLKALEQVGRSIDYRLTDVPAPVAPAPAAAPKVRADVDPKWVPVIGVGAFIIVAGAMLWMVALLVNRVVRAQALRRHFQPAAGETAAGAIEVVDVGEASAAGERVACGCGGRLTRAAASSLETARLGDAEVHSTRFTCGRCGRTRPLYFRVR